MFQRIVIREEVLFPFMLFQNVWTERLSIRFRNARQRDSDHIPCKRLKLHRQQDSEIKKGRPAWGVLNYLPAEETPGEDASTILCHIDWMKRESLKKRQDNLGIKVRMDRTFSDRRKKIVNEKLSVHCLMEHYPCLFSAEEVSSLFLSLQKYVTIFAMNKKLFDLSL